MPMSRMELSSVYNRIHYLIISKNAQGDDRITMLQNITPRRLDCRRNSSQNIRSDITVTGARLRLLFQISNFSNLGSNFVNFSNLGSNFVNFSNFRNFVHFSNFKFFKFSNFVNFRNFRNFRHFVNFSNLGSNFVNFSNLGSNFVNFR